MPEPNQALDDFLMAACVPLDSSHCSGTLERAEAILAGCPSLAAESIYAAAVLGDDTAVHRFVTTDPASASAQGGPYRWDPLTYLCFSRYLRLDRTRAPRFFRAAETLLNAGADANTGFFSTDHQPSPTHESVLYGAAGIAHDADLTRLLLERGADPNDDEVPYHSPEGDDNAALSVLLQSGRVSSDSLATMLLRKCDWHDDAGVKLLLDHGADPNRMTHWGKTALHQAVLRDNSIEIIQLLLDHGANPLVKGAHSDPYGSAGGESAVSLAAHRGRGDVLELFERRGFRIDLDGVDALLAACARHDTARARSIVQQLPHALDQLRADGGKVLTQFAGIGNTEGVRLLLDLGLDVAARNHEGEGYFDVAKESTALHVAAWRARPATVRLLITRGAPVNTRDAQGRTPLILAVRACVDSYWTDRRSPESVKALLEAGASVDGVPFPCGYAAVDELLLRPRQS
jgi:ankyrin repeat protein